MKKKILLINSLLLSVLSSWAQITWTDVTNKITNPSFETDKVNSSLTNCGWIKDAVTGWKLSPPAASNAQAGIGNSSSSLKGPDFPSSNIHGEKYFYAHTNWIQDVPFTVEQTISAVENNLPAGYYLLTCKMQTSSSRPSSTKWTLSIQEGDNAAVTNENAGSAAEWINDGVLIKKLSDETTLTISATMLPGPVGADEYYIMMLDDFQLKYVSASDLASVSESNPLDVSGVIYNAQIYNASSTVMPRGWIQSDVSGRSSNDFTTNKGDTQLEGWVTKNGSMNIDYYQTVKNLPEGKYRVIAKCQDDMDKGAYLYIYNPDLNVRQTADMGADFADVTTPAIFTTNQVNIGIKAEGVSGTCINADNFRLELVEAGQHIDRSTATGKYGTICLPYAASATGATVYSVALNDDKDAVVLTTLEGDMIAGTPYIYKATADAQTFARTFDGGMVEDPVAAAPLVGVFTATQVPVGAYVMQTKEGDQKFYKVAEGAQPTLSANKAYMTVPASGGVKAFTIGGEETAIQAINALTSDEAKIYDLHGRQLKSLQKGVNIVNGKKIIVK